MIGYKALLLYGSKAREDATVNSDTDLMGVSDGEYYQITVKSKINVSIYPHAQLTSMAAHGELFLLHIVTEAIPLVDPNNILESLRDRFQYRSSYDLDIQNASQLAHALINLERMPKNLLLYNRRVAWCARTILIGTAANDRVPIFSPCQIAEYFSDNEIIGVIKNKDSATFNPKAYATLSKIIEKYGLDYSQPVTGSLTSTIDFFEKTNNAVALKTFKLFAQEEKSDFYVYNY